MPRGFWIPALNPQQEGQADRVHQEEPHGVSLALERRPAHPEKGAQAVRVEELQNTLIRMKRVRIIMPESLKHVAMNFSQLHKLKLLYSFV